MTLFAGLLGIVVAQVLWVREDEVIAVGAPAGVILLPRTFSGRAGRGKKSESPTQEMLSDVPFVLNLVAWVVVVIAIVYRLRPG